MELKKTQLTFAEILQFINGVIDGVFIQDENGNDIDYSPALLQPLIKSTFVDMYTDYKFSDNFDENYGFYMNIDIDKDYFDKINYIQFNSMLDAIKDGIEFRKQKLLQSQSSVDMLFKELTNIVKKFSETINSNDITNLLPELAKLGKNGGINQKELVELIVKNRPQDHKKKTTKKKNTTKEKVGE